MIRLVLQLKSYPNWRAAHDVNAITKERIAEGNCIASSCLSSPDTLLVNGDINLVPHTDYILVISIDLHCAFLSFRSFVSCSI